MVVSPRVSSIDEPGSYTPIALVLSTARCWRHYFRRSNVVRGTGIEPATSSVSGKRSPAELTAPGQRIGGGDGNRTRVHGFAGRCLTTRPLHRGGLIPLATLERMTGFEPA